MIRKDLLKLQAYIAGKPIEETKRELGLKEIIKLASNENPCGPSPKAVKAIKEAASGINRYPDSQGFYLKEKIAVKFGLERQNICLGNGSDELIDVVIKTFTEKNEGILTAETTFLEYEIIARINGRKVVKVPLKNMRFDLKEMAKKINKTTKAVFIANPNNPTGTYICASEMNGFLKKVPSEVTVVIDEAYDTYIDVRDFPDTSKLLRRKNVIILKTFSKAYGLAGMRIGFALADKNAVSYMERVRQPFNVNLLAQVAAKAALEDGAFLKKTKLQNAIGKKYLYRQFEELGISYVPSVSNFILVDVKMNGRQLFKELLKDGVIVRDMDQYGLTNFVRITIGTPDENRKLIKALRNRIN